MGKTYEALKKAEAEKGAKPPTEFLSVDRRKDPEIQWNGGQVSQVEYQKIRVWLTNPAARDKRKQTIMVVGCHSGTGATTTAALLAATLAEGTKSRVLIIDSNFRTPSLNMVFQVKNNGGFTEAASEGAPFETHIQPTNRKNLYVLTCGQISNCPSEVFEGGGLDQLISQLKQKFDFIIFDTAPSLEFADSYALARKVDCIILVAESGKTRIVDIQIAKRDLERAGGQILGVVLNRQEDYTPAIVKRIFKIHS